MNGFNSVAAYAFLLAILVNGIFWILHGYQNAWGAFISAVCLSELFHDLASSGKAIKIHAVCSRIHKFLHKASKISYHVLIGRAAIWSVLFWVDPPDIKYLFVLYFLRKLAKCFSKHKIYVTITSTKIVLVVMLVPLIIAITIAPRIIKEFIMLNKLISRFVKSRDIPWKQIIEGKMRNILQQGVEVELSINGISMLFFPNAVKAYYSSGVVSALKASKDDIQAISTLVSSNEKLQKTLAKYFAIALKWVIKYIQTIQRLFIFLTTLLTFLNYKRSLLWYLEAALKSIDKSNKVVRTIKKSLKAIIYGGLIKLATNFWLLFFLGSVLKVRFYAISALASSLLCLVSQPLYHFSVLLISIYSGYTTSILKVLLAAKVFIHLKRGIRHWAHEREYRFPLTNVILGYLKFRLAGVFLWPISMSLLYEVYSLLFLQSQ